MVNVFIYGLDQFVVGDVSESLTPNLAKVMEISEDEINFVAPNDMVFHNGVEQTSWRVYVEVRLPQTFEKIQNQIRDVIIHYVKEVAIHIEVLFYYFVPSEHYQYINDDYDNYLEEDKNQFVFEDDEYESESVNEGEGEDEVYTGDIFSSFRNEEGDVELTDEFDDDDTVRH